MAQALANTSLNELIYGTVKRPRNVQKWEEYARSNTQKIIEQGSPSPLVWVFVKGKDVPPNAIIAGEERRHPLYIARTFWEGGICIGKAGRHLEKGAVFAYNGREFKTDIYEVLVPALHPLRYSFSDTVSVASIPRLARDVPNAHQEGLSSIKVVVVIDDSDSMAGRLWADTRDALAGVADVNARDPAAEGIDLHFLNSPKFATNLKDGYEVRKLFDLVQPNGATPTGRKLKEIFDKYLPLVEANRNHFRPISLIVITDGVPTDEPAEIIINAARRLDRAGVSREGRPFGIQFVQVGDDEEATEALKELDDDLAEQNDIRDMVDTTPFDPSCPEFNQERMLKILLGGVSRELDVMHNDVLSDGGYSDIRSFTN